MFKLRAQCSKIQAKICRGFSNKILIAFKANAAIKFANKKNIISVKDKNAWNYDIINLESQQRMADKNVGYAKFNKVVMVIIKVNIIEINWIVIEKE